MKKIGSTSDFTDARDRELYSNFRQLLRSADMPLAGMFAAAAAMPASRFWVSERRAADVIGAMLRRDADAVTAHMCPQKQRMYLEIFRRVKAIMAADRGLCMTHAVDAVVCSGAPEFYLTPKSARVIIYRIRRRLRAEQRRIEQKNRALRAALSSLKP